MPTIPSELLNAYQSTWIDVSLADETWSVYAGMVEAVLALPPELKAGFWVITPCNPQSQKVSDAENRERYVAFWEHARTWAKGLDRVCYRAVGRSEEGTWSEASVAFVGMAANEAHEWGRTYDQMGLYWVDASGVRIVAVGDAEGSVETL